MNKRHKFVLISALLVAGFLGMTTISTQDRFLAIAGLTVVTLGLFYWGLGEVIRWDATLLSLILPTSFTLGVGLFWFLLPSSIVSTLPVLVLYGLGVYALVSTTNILLVSTVKKIALGRAAKGVGFVLTLFTSFLLFDAVLSLRASIFENVVLVALISFALFMQGLWESRLTREIKPSLLVYSAVFSYFVTAVVALLYFWPVSVVVGSLFLTVAVYVLLGLGQAQLDGRLFKQTAREYVLVGLAVFLVMFLATSWRY